VLPPVIGVAVEFIESVLCGVSPDLAPAPVVSVGTVDVFDLVQKKRAVLAILLPIRFLNATRHYRFLNNHHAPAAATMPPPMSAATCHDGI